MTGKEIYSLKVGVFMPNQGAVFDCGICKAWHYSTSRVYRRIKKPNGKRQFVAFGVECDECSSIGIFETRTIEEIKADYEKS